MRDPAATAFERQFLAWLHIHFGVEPEERGGPRTFYWSFRFHDSLVTFVVIGHSMNSDAPPSAGIDWLLRVEEEEGAGFIEVVAQYFAPGSGVRRRTPLGRVRVQFKSTSQVRDFEDQRTGTGRPDEQRYAATAAPEPDAQMDPDLHVLMQSQFPLLVSRHQAGDLRPYAAFMNKDHRVFGDALDDDSPERTINRLAFKLRQGLRDGRVIAGAIFFHAEPEGESPILPDTGHQASVIAGYFEHRNGEAVKLLWSYRPADAGTDAPSRWEYAEPTLSTGAGLPVMFRIAARWSLLPDQETGGPIQLVAIDPGGNVALAILGSGTGAVIDMKAGERHGPLRPPELSGTAHALHPAQARLLQGEQSGALILHWFTSGRSAPIARAATGAIRCCAISANGSRALAGTVGGELLFCDLDYMTTRAVCWGEPNPIDACAITPDAQIAFSIAEGGSVTIWYVEHDMPVALKTLDSSLEHARAACVSANGRYAIAYGGQLMVMWDLRDQAAIRFYDAGSPIEAAAVSPNGQFVLMGLHSGALRLYDVHRDMPARNDLEASELVTALAFSPDGSAGLVGFANGALEYLGFMLT